MIEKEMFELEKDQVNWLISLGLTVEEAIALVAYSDRTSESIAVSFFNLRLKGDTSCSE